jgi:hypothetical protein
MQFISVSGIERRISKNQIKFRFAVCEIFEYIRFDWLDGFIHELFGCGFNEFDAARIPIHASDRFATAGCQLHGYGSGSAEKVQAIAFMQLDTGLKQVEQTCFRKISCWPYRQVAWGHKTPAFVFTTYDTQSGPQKRLKNRLPSRKENSGS